MANTKISALPANNNPTGSEELVYAYNNSNGKMTLNTMKTFASSDSQPTLVSGTNIKTINNQSILWAGNIDIQWGWWGGWVDAYDAVVDASGQGDYTTIGAAVDDNKRKIFVKNWTYNETIWHFVTMSAIDKFIIHGQTRTWVVVNATLTSVQTQWQDWYNYPALFFLDMRGSNSTDIDVRNITFNFSLDTSETEWELMRFYWKDNSISSISVDNCIFNVSNDWTTRAWFSVVWRRPNAWQSWWSVDITDCVFSMTSNTADLYLQTDEGGVRNDLWTYKNCYFTAKANNSNRWYLWVENASDCVVRYDETNMGSIQFEWVNLSNCDIETGVNVGAQVPISVSLDNINNCRFECRHASSYNPTKINVSSIVPEWQASTSYALWAQVLHGGVFYQCNIAHTSASDWYTDDEDDKWDSVATISINNSTWCTIETGETIQLEWVFKSNNLDMSYGNWDILMWEHCIMEWNFMKDDTYTRNMYVNNHCIVNWNSFGWYSYANNLSIRYVSTNENVITNNMLMSTANISKIWTWSAWVVANNASWS